MPASQHVRVKIIKSCAPTQHNFIAVDASPSQLTINQPPPPKIVKIFCTKCGEVRPLQ